MSANQLTGPYYFYILYIYYFFYIISQKNSPGTWNLSYSTVWGTAALQTAKSWLIRAWLLLNSFPGRPQCFVKSISLRSWYSDKHDFTACIIQSTSQGILLEKSERIFSSFIFCSAPNPPSILVYSLLGVGLQRLKSLCVLTSRPHLTQTLPVSGHVSVTLHCPWPNGGPESPTRSLAWSSLSRLGSCPRLCRWPPPPPPSRLTAFNVFLAGWQNSGYRILW